MIEAVIDTNVLMFGLIWGGYPGQIISSFGDSRLEIAVTKVIISEYLSIAERLEKKYPNTQVIALVKKLLVGAHVYTPVKLKKAVSSDPDDDKFIACALVIPT